MTVSAVYFGPSRSGFFQTLDMLNSVCECLYFATYRLDGSVLPNKRLHIVKEFNSSSDNNSAFLLSTKAGRSLFHFITSCAPSQWNLCCWRGEKSSTIPVTGKLAEWKTEIIHTPLEKTENSICVYGTLYFVFRWKQQVDLIFYSFYITYTFFQKIFWVVFRP